MISAWDIYWVMQLDSIGAVFGLLAIASVILAVILGIVGAFEKSCSNTFPEMEMSKQERVRGDVCHRVAIRAGVVAVATCLISAFIPSTKTAAMMLVIPAVANNEAIQREAGDLYGIAKDALRELAKPKQEASK